MPEIERRETILLPSGSNADPDRKHLKADLSLAMFSERKTAQMAAYLLSKESNSRLSHQKIMKLLYLADRESMKQFQSPMTGDQMVSASYGPILFSTLACMDGEAESSVEDGWSSWISSKENNEFALKKPVDKDDLDELSIADIEVLDKVWKVFGCMSGQELSDYTHERCGEWKKPLDDSSIPVPISYSEVFCALGLPQKLAEELEDDCKEDDRIDRYFASLSSL